MIPTKTGFMMSIRFFNDSWRNTGLMTCSTWEKRVVQPLCKLTNQYERITAQSVFGGCMRKKVLFILFAQYTLSFSVFETTSACSDWCFEFHLVEGGPSTNGGLVVNVGWLSLSIRNCFMKGRCLGNVPRKGRNTNMNHDFTSFSRCWLDSTHLKNH